MLDPRAGDTIAVEAEWGRLRSTNETKKLTWNVLVDEHIVASFRSRALARLFHARLVEILLESGPTARGHVVKVRTNGMPRAVQAKAGRVRRARRDARVRAALDRLARVNGASL